MGSLYLHVLTPDQRKALEKRLYETQEGKCFICEKPIDLVLHADAIDIDHVEPLKTGGKDDPANFALTHASCNRSKQARDLRVARVLARFLSVKDEVANENRGPNLGDVLRRYAGAVFDLPLRVQDGTVSYSLPDMHRNEVVRVPLYSDELSGLQYFFVKLPIEYLFHNDRINPRAIGGSLNGLIEEFHKKRPQLQVCLAWAEMKPNDLKIKVRVFDGQHKATAQVLLGVRELPMRVFLNPNLDTLLTANTNAGTTLRQIAFDKSVQRHLGSALFLDRLERYRKDRGLPSDAENFSERDLVNHFKGEWREMRRYILDAVRDGITHHPDNKLKDYIEFGGKGKERPLSYSSMVTNLTRMPLWINRDLSQTVFGGKQSPEYWQTVLESGKTPQGQQVMPSGLNLMKMTLGRRECAGGRWREGTEWAAEAAGPTLGGTWVCGVPRGGMPRQSKRYLCGDGGQGLSSTRSSPCALKLLKS